MPSLPDGLAIRLFSVWRTVRRISSRLASKIAAAPRRRSIGSALAVAALGIAWYSLRPAEQSPDETVAETPTSFSEIEFGGAPTVVVTSQEQQGDRSSSDSRNAIDWSGSPPIGLHATSTNDPYASFSGDRVHSAHYERPAATKGGVWLTGTIEDTSDRRETDY